MTKNRERKRCDYQFNLELKKHNLNTNKWYLQQNV